MTLLLFQKCLELLDLMKYMILLDYELLGIDHKYGESIPNFFDIYNFSVGDILEYRGSTGGLGYISPECTNNKVTILSKAIFKDSIVYEVSILSLYSQYCCPVGMKCSTSSKGITKWKFINSINNPENAFNNQLISFNNLYNSHGYNNKYTICRISKDSNNYYSKSFSNLNSRDCFNISDSINYFLRNRNDCIGTYEYLYKDGLGQVSRILNGFEYYDSYLLIGYKKGNDTIGTILSDDQLYVNLNKIGYNEIEIYPNPTIDYIRIKNIDDLKIRQITISDLKGTILFSTNKIIPISMRSFKPGIYLILIRLNNSIIRQKIIKNAS